MTNSTGAVRVASKDDLKEGKPFCATVEGKAIALFMADDKVYALDNACAHQGGPLCEGAVENGVVTCPWHGSRFKIESGDVVHGPAKKAVKSYPVELRGDDVYLVMDEAPADAKPKAVTFSFSPEFEKDRPFAGEEFVNELLRGLKFPFKLYGELPFVVISQDADEIDVHLGEIHLTEMDIKKLSTLMDTLNGKWGTQITYCLFHSTQFPGAMLLNIRGPKAPMTMENTIKF